MVQVPLMLYLEARATVPRHSSWRLGCSPPRLLPPWRSEEACCHPVPATRQAPNWCANHATQVAGSEGTLRVDDFVIPSHELEQSFVVTHDHRLANTDTVDATSRDRVDVRLQRPQEVEMWAAFGACVRATRGGAPPDERWPRLAELTQKVCCAVEQSASQGGKLLSFKEL